jgi:hypothetical protein
MTLIEAAAIPVYEATIYHDSEDNAADDSREIGYFPTLRAAVKAVNAARDEATGWYTGGVRHGFLHPAVFGVRPERFEDDETVDPWFVGLDGKAVR